MSIDKWMGKEDVVYIYNGILLNHKKDWNSVICSNMNGPRYYQTTWRQRKTNIIYHLNVEFLKNASKLIYRTEIDSQTQKTSIWFLNNKGEGIN